ncbi:MAG: polysaccharide pyruvyl transferase family protein [Puniceicoccales bacterium]|nr:polysaccharide pyruvyl transferase family protein [Puniceicoccales bacterium]
MDNNLCHNCTGCGTCANICPRRAIEMRENVEGFLYPHINMEKCVDCGLCAKTCPVLNPKYENNKEPLVYAAMASDELRAKSSSGGIFSVLALHTLNAGGAVCGAAFNTKKRNVEHIIIDSTTDLHRLQSSKYLQSDTRHVYSEIKELLNAGKIVLFTGTPCQNGGLHSYLGGKPDNLFMLDIVCHGTPSPKVYRKYLDELALGGDFIKTDFRDKRDGWKSALITTTVTTTTTYSRPASDDDFMLAFLKNLCLRKSCGKCPFNKLPRQGDLTIGDFWGVPNNLDDRRGTSVILVNNPLGKKLLAEIGPQLKLLKETTLAEVLPGNPCINGSTTENPLREEFFENLDKKSMHENVSELVNRKYDYLCLNFWTSLNYGAVLTAYAAQELLADLGYTSAHIDYRYSHIVPEKFDGSFTDNFARKYLHRTAQCRNIWNFDELNKMARRGFIVGSDQVFRDNYISDTYFWYLFGFVAPEKQRIALAASFGKDSFDLPVAKPFFDCFDAISVREDEGLKFVPNGKHILDPVFLADSAIFHRLADSVQTSPCKVVGYVLDEDEIDAKYDKNMAKENVSVEEYLSHIKNAELVITDSFHGICFAILFNRPFITLGNVVRGSSRFDSLFRDLGIKDFDNPDWAAINATIAKRRVDGVEWLKSVLKNKQTKNPELREKLRVDGMQGKKKKLTPLQKIFSITRCGDRKQLCILGKRIKI